MEDYIWNNEDLRDLDAKFDALIEYLNLEFVFERVSDGSDIADSTRCYARPKSIEGIQNLAAAIAPPSAPVSQEKVRETATEYTPTEMETEAVEPPTDYYSKKKKRY